MLTLHVTRGTAAAVDAAAAAAAAAMGQRPAVTARWGPHGQPSRVAAPYMGGGGGTLNPASPGSLWSGLGGGGGGSTAVLSSGGGLTTSKLTFVEVRALPLHPSWSCTGGRL